MVEDNWSRQADEIEALSSIFSDQFTVDDPVNQNYSILIIGGNSKTDLQLTLQVTFSSEYPSDAPPIYQLNAPWLRGKEKQMLADSLEEIYCENLGESIVFKWTEKIKEFLNNKSDALEKTSLTHFQSEPTDELNLNERLKGGKEDNDYDYEEEDYDDYGFNPEFHVYKAPLTARVESTTDASDDGIELPPIYHGEFVKDRKSVFQGHLSPVTHKKQVQMVLDKLKENKKIAAATHNIIAYRIDCGRDVFITGCEDDGEIHAGSRMLHLFDIVDARNVLVIITRWYGGVHLGPDRFKHINNCTRVLLEEHGYIKDKTADKKGPKSQATNKESQSQRHGKKVKS